MPVVRASIKQRLIASCVLMLTTATYLLRPESSALADQNMTEGRHFFPSWTKSEVVLYEARQCDGTIGAKRIVGRRARNNLTIAAESLKELSHAVPSDYTSQYGAIISSLHGTAKQYQSVVEAHLTSWNLGMNGLTVLREDARKLKLELQRRKGSTTSSCTALLKLSQRSARAVVEHQNDQVSLVPEITTLSNMLQNTTRDLDIRMNRRTWKMELWLKLRLDLFVATHGFTDSSDWLTLPLAVVKSPVRWTKGLWKFFTAPDSADGQVAQQGWKSAQLAIQTATEQIRHVQRRGRSWVQHVEVVEEPRRKRENRSLYLLVHGIQQRCSRIGKSDWEFLETRVDHLLFYLDQLILATNSEVDKFLGTLGERSGTEIVKPGDC